MRRVNLRRLATALGSHVDADGARARGRGTGLGTRLAHRLEIDAFRAAALGLSTHGAKLRRIADAVVVRLDPGLAFGTGTHPTTALCLQDTRFAAPGRPLRSSTTAAAPASSALAALKLGAARVIAVDLDPQALLATRENARHNDVASGIEVQGIGGAIARGVLRDGQYSRRALDRIGAEADGRVRTRRPPAAVGPAENPGLRGQSGV